MSTPDASDSNSTLSNKGSVSVFRSVQPHMKALDYFMAEQVNSFEPEIRHMAQYCLDTTGKRLRPALVFFSGWGGETVIQPELVRVAGVIEMVHLATLVHDDIMDKAGTRRGRKTATREFGPDAAVLLGDALFCQALHVASQFPSTEVCRLVASSTKSVCSGEIMQTLRRRDMNLSLTDYYRIIDLKTAELFRISCRLGSLIGGQQHEFVEAATVFGRHLGIAYQIYDDLVDFLGEENAIGKTLGTDLATGKLTLPLMLLLEKVNPEERSSMIQALSQGSALAINASINKMRALDIPGCIAKAIDDDLGRARAALAEYPLVHATSPLFQLCDMLERQVAALRDAN